ncbi:porin [Vibrio caribbeanicus]|uniref:Outer membrane protein OmpU n=1 Tax=Vibrio caribbeanicus ATCC BAA-2122 TaxID=796620 RepID=E3BM71_9VIBR|nr:porin [Vibrio caribbeanicus]EFP95999.1 outer membrane protein OmpU [Vibrio caribbeanicus ATCC BAA-2122]
MNKTIIALAVSAAAVASGANAAELYNQDGTSLTLGGRAEARMAMKDGKAEDNSRVRVNIEGKTQITDSLYGIGFYEGQFTSNEKGRDTDSSEDSVTNRYLYGGIGGNFGEVTYGKNEGALGVITDFTDIMAYHGNSAAYKIAIADRTDNMLTYKGQFDDLSVKASYRFADAKESSNSKDSLDDNDADGYSLSTVYAIGDSGVKLGAGYADGNQYVTKFKNATVASTLLDRSQYMLAASYEISDFYFAANYVDGQDKLKNGSDKVDKTGYEFAAAYTMDKTVFTTTYNKLRDKVEGGNKYDTADNIAVDATYYFKPNFRGYVSYNFNLLDEDTDNNITKAMADDEVALGLRYDF